MEGNVATEFEVRRRPVQQRAKASVDRILVSTGQLLEELGTDDVSTDLIAERAGVNIATLYKYFPNKLAVYVELFRRQSSERYVPYAWLLEVIDAGGDWRAALKKCLRQVAHIRRSQPGNLTLRLSMRASPALRHVGEKLLDRYSRELAMRFERTGNVTPRQARVAARVTFEVTASLLDFWNSTPNSRSSAVFEEMCRVIEACLAPYLDRR